MQGNIILLLVIERDYKLLCFMGFGVLVKLFLKP